VQLLPRSPRRRRRLGWTTVAAAVIGAGAVVITLLPNAEKQADSALVEKGATTAAEGPPLALVPARRREIDRLVRNFTVTAVTRADPAAAWKLVSPAMQAAVSRKAWDRGDLPGVLPFEERALKGISWKVVYRTPKRVGLDVLVVAKSGSTQRTLVYQADLVLTGGRLLIDAWAPQAALVGGALPKAAPGPPAAEGQSPNARGRLDARWLLVPAAIVATLLLVPATLLARNVLRARRGARDHGRRVRA